jgi:proline iminopeptidase
MSRRTRLARLALPLALALAAACSSVGPVNESYVQTTDSALLHYRSVGEAGPAVLVLGAAWFSPDLDRLARGRRLYYYDLRNRGRSGRAGSVRMEKDLEDLQTVLDWLELERVTLVGWDYAAALASLYAAEHPERIESLVLISPLPPRKFPYWNIYDRIYGERVDSAAFQRLRELQRNDARRLDPDAWARAYKETVLSGWVVDMRSLSGMKAAPLVAPNLDPEPLHRQYKALLAAQGEWDWREQIARVACPTLVVTGAEDPVPPQSNAEWVETLPQGRAEVLPSTGRMPWLEQPKGFFDAVEAFLPAAR